MLLLDEPSMGLAPMLVAADLRDHHRDQPAGHDDPARRAERRAGAAALPHRAYVLETGRIVRTDDAKVLLGDDSVRAAYLGGDVEG